MVMAERQSAHRESLEAMVVAGNVASQKQGSIFAFILCLVALIGGFGLLATGRSEAGGIASIISSLSVLAGVFVYGRLQQRKERGDKSDALTSRRRS